MRFLAIFLCATAVVLAQDVKPSRAPKPGCVWKPWQDAQLGISLLVQECQGSMARQFVADVNILRSVVPGNEASTGQKVVVVLEKPDRQKMDEALKKRFFPSLTARQVAGCEIADLSEDYALGAGKYVYQIRPNSVYKAEAEKMRADDSMAEVCGPFGEMPTPQYLEYHPSESAKKYLLVRLGGDGGLIDEKSIRIITK